MTCTTVREYLFAFLDSELDAPLSLDIQRHIERCPVCAREAEIERTVRKRLVKTIGTREPEPPFDAAAFLTTLHAADRRAGNRGKRRTHRRSRVAAGCALAACFLPVAWLASHGSRDTHAAPGLADLLVADFRHFVHAGEPLDWISDNARETSAWIHDRMRIDVALPAAQGSECRLVGARACKLAGQPAAFAVYRLRGAPAAVVVLARGRLDVDRMKQVKRKGHSHWIDRCKGHTVLACRQGNLIYAAISTRPESELYSLMPGALYESH